MRPAPLLLGGAAATAAAAWALLRDRTTDSDETGEDVAPVPPPQGGSLGERAVAAFQRHVGERGLGKRGTSGYHRGAFVDLVNRGLHGDAPDLLGGPWCARGLRYAYEAAAEELGLPPPFTGLGDLASVSKWKRALRNYKIDVPKVGAGLLLGDEHATLVARVLGPREVVSVEGNHGDAVANVKRTVRPQDTLLDVETFVASQMARPAVVGGLDFYGRRV